MISCLRSLVGRIGFCGRDSTAGGKPGAEQGNKGEDSAP
jgi:hypothetical protein